MMKAAALFEERDRKRPSRVRRIELEFTPAGFDCQELYITKRSVITFEAGRRSLVLSISFLFAVLSPERLLIFTLKSRERLLQRTAKFNSRSCDLNSGVQLQRHSPRASVFAPSREKVFNPGRPPGKIFFSRVVNNRPSRAFILSGPARPFEISQHTGNQNRAASSAANEPGQK